MARLNIDLKDVPEELRRGLSEIMAERRGCFGRGGFLCTSRGHHGLGHRKATP